MRLFHKLFLLISLSAMLAAIAVAGVLAWNLDRGFTDYLDARDAQQLDQFVADFETRLIETDRAAQDVPDAALIRSIVDRMAQDGAIRRPPPSGRRDAAGPPIGRRRPPRPDQAPGNRGSRPSPPPDAFEMRLRIMDGRGERVFGLPPAPVKVAKNVLSRTIAFDQVPVAKVELLPRGPAPRTTDGNFLRSQYIGLFAITLIMLVLSALAAFILARAGVRQISALDDVTNAIADGNLGARADVMGNDEIAQMGGNINKMAASLEQLEGARRRWLAEISHELRTPLSVLTGELEALRNGIRPLNVPAVLSLSEEVDQLNHLIEDLHFLAVSDLGTPLVNFGKADAVAIITDTAARFALFLDEQGHHLTVETGSLTTLPVNWDRQRIDQVLANVITNAGRYTDAPGEVRLSLSAENGFATIAIEDSPPGVPSGQSRQLFEPLYRLEAARDRASGGSGLGLSVAKAIAVAHGGEMSAGESRLGGLKIEIRLPLDPSAR